VSRRSIKVDHSLHSVKSASYGRFGVATNGGFVCRLVGVNITDCARRRVRCVGTVPVPAHLTTARAEILWSRGHRSVRSVRKVSLGLSVSLDGFAAGPAGELDWMFANLSDEVTDYLTDALRGIDTMLIGRVNYAEQAGYWPARTDAHAELVNGHTKVVFSTTLTHVDWANSHLATRPPAEEIAHLRRQPGATIGVAGGVRFAASLLAQRLIDELRLVIHPVLLGRGLTPFVARQQLRLVRAHQFGNGVVAHIYEVAHQSDPTGGPK
jgi:dihydrofolate reductase